MLCIYLYINNIYINKKMFLWKDYVWYGSNCEWWLRLVLLEK